MVGSFVNINVTMIANPKPSLKWGNYKGFKWEITHLKSYKYAGLSKIIISDRTSFRNYSMKVCNSVGCAVKNITVLDEGTYHDVHVKFKVAKSQKSSP